MKDKMLRPLRDLTVTYSKTDLLAVSLIAVVTAIWAGVAGGAFSFRALVACEALFLAFYLVGSLLAGWKALAAGVLFDLPLRLLLGYGVVNTALLALAWLSPLGILANFAFAFALAVLVLVAAGARKQVSASNTGLWVVVICLGATTLWCRDSIDPISREGDFVVFKPWVDGFYHAVHVRIFAESHGAATIEDFRLAGVPARLYHYGAYLLPALVKQASGIHSYTAFAGIQAPVGVFFTGLAAYAFVGSSWGAWPGLAASAALLLLPDGAQQGMQNPFMSYHWLTQISPSSTFGLALIAVAWLFVVQGCKNGSRLQLISGWVLAGIACFYKLHFVLASALLLWLVPVLFFRAPLGARKRTAWGAAAAVVYVTGLYVGQKIPGFPLVRFDGSSAGEILRLIQTFARPSALKDFVVAHSGASFHWISNLLVGIPYVLFTALGLFVPLLAFLVFRLRRRVPLLDLLFPLLLVVNFLVMFFGLALDFVRSTPDELSHRPIMMVYFFVVTWIGGALGFLLVEAPRQSRVARPALLGLAAVLMVVPALLGPGVQLMWAMPKISPCRVPAYLVRVADYIREHGRPDDVFQDSQFDRTYTIAALSERRPFVAHTMTTMPFRAETVAARSAAVDRLMSLPQPKLARGTARAYGLRWFVVHRGNPVKWPAELANDPAFKAGPITLYEF
jgi:hypothetical protein